MFTASFRYLFLISLSLHSFLIAEQAKKTVCLNMIVKNEAEVICRCLESVKPLIDYWVIVDTGSNDRTQEIIKEFMKDIPGELHERPWIDFAHNRTQALELARGKADYLLFIDADETLLMAPDFKLPPLDKDFYFITTEYSGTKYGRVQLINNHLNWKWTGVLHEAVDCPQATTRGTIIGLTNFVRTDGARSKDPQKFQKDILVLENALKTEPHNTRYAFYLAQTYKDAGEYEKAIASYHKRIAMGGWDQEIYWSKLQIALLQELLNKDPETIVEGYRQAYLYRPSRAEPLYRLANYYRRNEQYQAGYEIANQGLHIKDSSDTLFVEHWIYDYGLLLEFSICAYWVEKYQESLLASNLLLTDSTLPNHVLTCVKANLGWIHLKLNETIENYKKTLISACQE
ncbi:MAG: glycosyl transferase family 2 [Parachlamydia sp.]|nr:MAG: glycosyl transferase family 2 [Parachlamydia sp.]